MRAKEAVLRMVGGSLAVALIVASCAHVTVVGSQPKTHRLVVNGQEVEVETGIDDATPMVEELVRRGMSVSALWRVPGEPTMRLGVVEKPAAETVYGPQMVAVGVGGDVRVLHESPRLYDDDFVHPTFFAFSNRTLILADHGSEDAYGVLAWSIENGAVRDLGQLQIALPEENDVFTRGAAATARVEMKDGKYVITIPGPVLLNPRGEDERQLAKKGEIVTFRESAGRFQLVHQ
jgi:hypothetical protein